MSTLFATLLVIAAGEAPKMDVKKVDALKAMLTEVLQKTEPKSKIDARVENDAWLPGFTVIAAAVENAYPGSGVARVYLSDKNISYGLHGERDFADLVRELGWTKSPPEMNILEHVANVALFEGIAIFTGRQASKIANVNGAWTLTMYRSWHPSGGQTTVTITVPDKGKVKVESK